MGKHNKVTGQNGQAGPISRAINFLAFNSKSVSQIGLNFVAAGILGPSLYGEVAIVLAIYAVTTFLLEQGWTVGILSGSVERAEFARQVRRSTVRVGIFSLSALALCSAVGNLYSSRIVAYCIAILAIAVPLRVASIVLTSVALACGRIHTVSASELCGASVGFGVGVAIAGLLHNGIAVIIGYLIIDLILLSQWVFLSGEPSCWTR